ncbi:MAG: TMEM175 family protein [Novosphingobium sp.]
MSDGEPAEGRAGVNRIEAFSDGVLAIIITIMVLELKAPESPGAGELLKLWPTFLAYVLSYAYIAIYWVNHHRLFGHAKVVTDSLVWSNIALLFALSLVPFTTAYLDHHFMWPLASLLYAASLLLPAVAYTWLLRTIAATGRQDTAARAYYRAIGRKGLACNLTYAGAAALAWWVPLAGVIIPAIIAVLWMKPWSRIDSWLLGCPGPDGE